MTDLKGYKILLVDDDEDEYLLTKETVSHFEPPFQLEWISTFDEAVKAVMRGEHEVYLFDYRLGAQSGVDLLQTVRQQGCRAPIIILTGMGSRDVDQEALNAGATDYLDKNMVAENGELLWRAIRYAVKHQQDQNELEDLYHKVKRLEQLKTDMIRIASHDLRTPIQTMKSSVELLEEDLVGLITDDHQYYLDRIKEAIQRMRQLISDILSNERIGSLTYDDLVNLTQLIQALYQTHCANGQHQFALKLPEDPVFVQGERAELNEAVENYITNAIKYTPSDGKIHVTLEQKAGEIVFTVTDTGYGIPEEKQAQIFQPFYRAQTRETLQVEGTGLGLHIVKNIIERHDGTVFFKSKYHEGSTFGFRLPVAGES